MIIFKFNHIVQSHYSSIIIIIYQLNVKTILKLKQITFYLMYELFEKTRRNVLGPAFQYIIL